MVVEAFLSMKQPKGNDSKRSGKLGPISLIIQNLSFGESILYFKDTLIKRCQKEIKQIDVIEKYLCIVCDAAREQER